MRGHDAELKVRPHCSGNDGQICNIVGGVSEYHGIRVFLIALAPDRQDRLIDSDSRLSDSKFRISGIHSSFGGVLGVSRWRWRQFLGRGTTAS